MKKLLSLPLLSLALLPATALAEQAYCREYTKSIVVGNQLQEGYGTACLQPDGSWQVVSEAQPVPQNIVTTTYVRDTIPLPSVTAPMWERRVAYYDTRPRYHAPSASSFLIGFNFDSGSFFSHPRRHYHDYDRHKRWDNNRYNRKYSHRDNHSRYGNGRHHGHR